MNLRCIHCAGKGACGRPFCPIQQKLRSQAKANDNFKKDYFGEAPNVFIGSYGYPNVNVGILSNETVTEEHDNPRLWSEKDYKIPSLIDLRTSLVNSHLKAGVKSFDDKFIEMTQEVSMASRPTDVEVKLEKKPQFSLSYNQEAAPFGPSVRVQKAELAENPRIPVHVEKTVSDRDLHAKEGMEYLYDKGFDEHYLTKLISVGNLGLGANRKLVPTRWSITATDDIIGKHLLENVRDNPDSGFEARYGGYLGNNYLILFFPGNWAYELFEIMESSGEYSTDSEGFGGRKDYATNTVGGYYATRLAVLEHLEKARRQASVLVFRFISEDYYAPMGVWVVRQATRNALSSRPETFSSREELLAHARKKAFERNRFDLKALEKRSLLLGRYLAQSRLQSFM